MRYDMDWLLEKVNKEDKIDYLFFWGHQHDLDNPEKVDRPCLSQWYDNNSSFTILHERYRTAEHWMMTHKARLFDDDEMVDRILVARTAAKARKLGRLVQPYEEKKWMENARDIVVEGNYHKFGQNPKLKDYLLSTGDKVLVESTPLDTLWGIGFNRNHRFVNEPANWNGTNWMGFALMEVRDLLAAKEYEAPSYKY